MGKKYPGKVEEKPLIVTVSRVWECWGNRWKEGRLLLLTLHTSVLLLYFKVITTYYIFKVKKYIL